MNGRSRELVEVTCLRCTGLYTQSGRNSSQFCHSCREAINREKTRVKMKQRRKDTRELRDIYDKVMDQLEEGSGRYVSFEEFCQMSFEVDQVGPQWWLDEHPSTDLVSDRLLVISPEGPSEGSTTSDKEFQGWLDTRARQAANHPWWDENRHWRFELHNPDEAGQYMGLRR